MLAKTTNNIKQDIEFRTNNLAETIYCDHSHSAILELSRKFVQDSSDTIDLVEKIFLFVRDSIIFGGDQWQVKASETLAKGYGACFNKNLLMISLLSSDYPDSIAASIDIDFL